MSADQPEYLDSLSGVSGTPADPHPRRPGGGRRTALVVGGTIAGLALLGGATWAALAFFGTGAQPAEALPDSTIAYASIDLDPSGGQKIEALQTLRKFPAFKESVGIGTDDDVRKWLVDELTDGSGCADVDYADDVEPWLGDRFAVAAVDTGDDSPTPVLVLQVTDGDGADDGLAALRSCAGATDDDVAWHVGDGWALLGETQKVVDGIAADAAAAPLAEDDDFAHWTDEAGDSGIASFYLAPALGDLLADDVTGLAADDFGMSTDDVVPTETLDAVKDFAGAAGTIRFDDGGLELEVAADPGAAGDGLSSSDRAGETISTLPDDTALAIGMALGDGWFDRVESSLGADAIDGLAEATGLDLPDDVTALVGDSFALSVGSGFDLHDLALRPQTGSSPDAQVGVKIHGDADGIEGALDKVCPGLGGDCSVIGHDSDGAWVAVSPSDDYRGRLLEDGGLADSDSFRRVVEHVDDAAVIVYLDFDAAGRWSDQIAEETGQDNLEPLDAFGLSSWIDEDAVHAVIKVTTD